MALFYLKGVSMIEIIGIETIMKDYNLSRKEATKYLNRKNCPTLPRQKGQNNKIARQRWEKWLLGL